MGCRRGSDGHLIRGRARLNGEERNRAQRGLGVDAHLNGSRQQSRRRRALRIEESQRFDMLLRTLGRGVTIERILAESRSAEKRGEKPDGMPHAEILPLFTSCEAGYFR